MAVYSDADASAMHVSIAIARCENLASVGRELHPCRAVSSLLKAVMFCDCGSEPAVCRDWILVTFPTRDDSTYRDVPLDCPALIDGCIDYLNEMVG